MQDTLYKRISSGKGLTESEIDEMVMIFGKHCREKTVRRLRSVCTYLTGVENVGIFERVHLENGHVSYCAGQSYPDEIRTVRKCLLGN